jgi:hypothetical protein
MPTSLKKHMKSKLPLLALALAGICASALAAPVDSFDNLGTFGWHDQTSLMFQDNSVFHEGTGSMRVDFTQTSSWDDWVTSKDFWSPNQLNWSAYDRLSFWTKVSDMSGRERIDEIALWDLSGKRAGFVVPAPTTTAWTEVIAPFSGFSQDAGFNISEVKALQIKFTTWDTRAPGTSSVWLDNMQVNVIPEPSALALLGLGSLFLLRRKA